MEAEAEANVGSEVGETGDNSGTTTTTKVEPAINGTSTEVHPPKPDDTHENVTSQTFELKCNATQQNNAYDNESKLVVKDEDFEEASDEDASDDEASEDDESANLRTSTDPYAFSDKESSIKGSSDHHPQNQNVSDTSRLNSRPDSRLSDLEDEDRLVIADDDLGDKNHLNLKENVLNLKSDKPRKKHLRFNGMPEEEVAKKILPDLIRENLDILMIGVNPGLYAAFKGHHYAGPGNHFWKCMFLGGLTPKSMCADDDYKLLDHGIGFTNVVMRATRGNANLSRKEIEEGSTVLIDKIKQYKPKIAVFNGKGIYEVFSRNAEFHFGKQPDKIEDTDTYVWVMPNSSARCAQLPRAVDKVPFYAALKKFRDYLRGEIAEIDESEVVFTDIKLKSFHDGSPKFAKMNSEFKISDGTDENGDLAVDIRVDPLTGKKRRGRPPKPRADGSLPPPKRRVVLDENGRPIPRASNPIDPATGRKKRGRPKKADMLAAQAAFDAESSKHRGEPVPEGLLTPGPPQEYPNDPPAPQPAPQPVAPLPPFSPNFGRGSSSLGGDTESTTADGDTDMKATDDLSSGCDPPEQNNVPPSGTNLAEAADRPPRLFADNEQTHPHQMQSSPTVQHHQYNFSTASNSTSNGYKSFSPNFSNYANGAGSPLHSGFERMKTPVNVNTPPQVAAGAPAPGHPQGQSPMRTTNDDVTTKSISGLESLVDQIPAIAENDSGVFSGSGAGSHPNTPRSVGPYSPAGPAGQNFHTSPFHTPTNHFNNVPSTSDTASETPPNFHHPPTDFSVNSLVHHHARSPMAGAPPQTNTPSEGLTPPAAVASTFADSSSFSVSSLTSNYTNEMASKYAAASGNPYTSSFLGSSTGISPGSFFGQPMAGSVAPTMTPAMAMGSAAMSYYGQYSNTYGAASYPPSPYSAYMPNPGYPYSHHYGQSPYSQSPYF